MTPPTTAPDDHLTPRERELIAAARSGGELVCSELEPGELAASEDPEHLIHARVLRDLLIGRHKDLDPPGIRLTGARIVDALDLDGVHASTGLWLENCVLDEPLQATFATLPFLLVQNGQSTGIDAHGLRVDSDLILVGVTINGGVDLTGAHIAGNLVLTTMNITNHDGSALHADNIHIGGDLFLREGTRLTGTDDATLRLVGAHITGDLDIAATEITNPDGSALIASRIRIDGGFFLRERVQLTGTKPVRLAGAHVSGNFGTRGDDVDVQVTAGDAPLLDLQEMVVATTVALPPDLICPDQSHDPKATTCRHRRQVHLEHLSYAALGADLDWRQWLHVIRCHTPTYHASPYQQLAATERAAGHDGNARQILIAQQHDLRRRAPHALGSWVTQSFHFLWGALAGYGYRARRTALALLVALLAAGALGWWAGQVVTRPGHHVAERVTPAGTPAATPGVPCSFIELVGLGLDRGLPLGVTGLRARCDLDTAARKGQAFTAAIWGVQIAVWGLATLALAGYTNLVRKTG